MAVNKTNAMRILDRKKLPYSVLTYDPSGEIDGLSVAHKLNESTDKIYKTIVTLGKSGKNYVFVIPVNCELDLKKCAQAAKEKALELVHVKDLFSLTGYIRGGCSPIGMKKPFSTFVQKDCLSLNELIVSGGKIGCQIVLSPEHLEKATQCVFFDIIREKDIL